MKNCNLNDSNKKKLELINKIQEFCLMDDAFMSRVFDDNIECTELILRIILNNPNIKVKTVRTQQEIKNLLGHSVRLDIEAIGINNSPIDIEIQRTDEGSEVKRARYNSSLIDANTLNPGENYVDLPETYVIFITKNDVIENNLPIYHADRIIMETGNPFGDGTHIIYVNGSYIDDSPLGKLMHDFSCKNPSEMYYELLAKHTKYYKENQKGVESMSGVMEEIIEQEKKEMVAKMKKMRKLTDDEIATITGLPVEEVKAIKESDTVCA